MQIALGTAQFGLAYGIAGRSEPMNESDARAVLEIAHAAGISMLDTAVAYGDIEQRLRRLAANLGFRVVTKIPALPAGLDDSAAAAFVRESIERSRSRLGDCLAAILFHRCADLQSGAAAAVWRTASSACADSGVQLGVSCYEPAELIAVRRTFPIAVAQLPGNALDQRLVTAYEAGRLAGVEVHMRSVFLQGLLLMSVDDVARRVPLAGSAAAVWRRWCADRALPPLRAAIAVAKAMPGVSYAVVGVDSPAHLEQIVHEWSSTPALPARELACETLEVLDPRQWQAA